MRVEHAERFGGVVAKAAAWKLLVEIIALNVKLLDGVPGQTASELAEALQVHADPVSSHWIRAG